MCSQESVDDDGGDDDGDGDDDDLEKAFSWLWRRFGVSEIERDHDPPPFIINYKI